MALQGRYHYLYGLQTDALADTKEADKVNGVHSNGVNGVQCNGTCHSGNEEVPMNMDTSSQGTVSV
jgi:hypothetical protein